MKKTPRRKLLNGGEIGQETRRLMKSTGKTILMRVKEGSDDYRYFPELTLYLYILMMLGKSVFVRQFLNYQMSVKLSM
ncbi:aspartyl/glutamyl-tRNA amidotransferase subunit B [Staphylococcus aureus]|uniref:Aspartyl/glutamyl-tRNA amidotransferase subunit B n=1 Tax=Staphylococcus aureus TaxID=1280 RepID=A0A380E5Y3_STAAU|nr:aspartyl/glutamyl-tRNA amidotransferase subunit B [Staphylococcus aureus]